MEMRAHESQRSNKLVAHIRRAKVVFGPSSYDFEPGLGFGVFFLSLRTHLEVPTYLFRKIEELKAKRANQPHLTPREPIVLLFIDASLATPKVSAAFSTLQLDLLACKVRFLPAYTLLEAAKYLEQLHLQEKESATNLRNYSHTIYRQKQELIKRVPNLSDSPTYVRQTLFITSIPKFNIKDAQHLLATSTSLKQSLLRITPPPNTTTTTAPPTTSTTSTTTRASKKSPKSTKLSTPTTTAGIGQVKLAALHAFLHRPFK
ncbi:DNA excision repair protein ERCC-1 [Nematocida homosporus]|uniref:DNA excision repair protein ERCC-1 n=1 Tax=Nematocida homosporus TaxID=1912981 RepID=UPI00221F4CC9|nr:DNA excision repair protein ERCC-1 [Nematocida homosporus]KAI5185652.1 DNA excision repair protein ERCC-1 [Nematocida homosporus]